MQQRMPRLRLEQCSEWLLPLGVVKMWVLILAFCIQQILIWVSSDSSWLFWDGVGLVLRGIWLSFSLFSNLVEDSQWIQKATRNSARSRLWKNSERASVAQYSSVRIFFSTNMSACSLLQPSFLFSVLCEYTDFSTETMVLDHWSELRCWRLEH